MAVTGAKSEDNLLRRINTRVVIFFILFKFKFKFINFFTATTTIQVGSPCPIVPTPVLPHHDVSHSQNFNPSTESETIPCIKRKANCDLKWITDKCSTFAERLVAFSAVEAFFFEFFGSNF